MALPTSGPLSLNDIQTEFGGSNPIGLNEYYGVASGIPASGTISIDNFYGASVPLWTPEQMSTHTWLDASDTSTINTFADTYVMEWRDKSGNNRHPTPQNYPRTNRYTLNGKNVIDFSWFDSQYFVLQGLSTSSLPSGASVFIMFRNYDFPSTAEGSGLWQIQNSGSMPYPANHFTWSDGWVYDGFGSTTRVQITSRPNLSSWTLYNVLAKPGLRQSRWNGGGLAYSASNTFSITGATYLGVSTWPGQAAYFWHGQIAEFIIVGGDISTADRQRMEGYLAHKWGRTSTLPSSHPYKSVHP